MPDVSQIMAQLQSWLIDYDGTPIPDGALPIVYPTAGDLRALLDEVTRLREERDEAVRLERQTFKDAAAVQTSVEALLREAGEVMRLVHQFITNGVELGFIIRMPDANVPDPAHEVPEIVRAFLAKLNPAPQPREDTYPDRVSMEPWPYSGHAPGGSDADQ